jgi:hypothetical protein
MGTTTIVLGLLAGGVAGYIAGRTGRRWHVSVLWACIGCGLMFWPAPFLAPTPDLQSASAYRQLALYYLIHSTIDVVVWGIILGLLGGWAW